MYQNQKTIMNQKQHDFFYMSQIKIRKEISPPSKSVIVGSDELRQTNQKMSGK